MKKKQRLEEQAKRELAEIQKRSTILEAEYNDEINQDPEYSLIVDPTNKYKFPKEQREFIRLYVNYKSITAAAEYAHIDMEKAQAFLVSFESQQEIRRINRALYHRQFQTRLATLNEIGGYLTALLIGDNVPEADKPQTISERLAVVRLLIDMNKLKIEGMARPDIIMEKNFDEQLRSLSIDSLRELISKSEEKPKDAAFDSNLTPEENAYLSTLPTEQIIDILNSVKEKKDDQQN